MFERAIVLFSGGTDSALTAVRMLDDFECVDLFTVQPGHLLRLDRVSVMARTLTHRFGAARVRHVVVDGREAAKRLLWKPLGADLKRYGFGMTSLVCLSCRLSMQALAIIHALREGVPYVAEGSQRVQADIPEQLEAHVLRNQQRVGEAYGVVHLTPIYEEPHSDRVLFDLGVVPRDHLKKQFILYDTQATCPFGVPADVYARIFFGKLLPERREHDTAELARERHPEMERFIRESLAAAGVELDRAVRTNVKKVSCDGYLEAAVGRGITRCRMPRFDAFTGERDGEIAASSRTDFDHPTVSE